jgi:ADP-ribose pyrophosphatase YjhB (NUDIX family)
VSVKRGVECWITFPDRRFLLLRPADSPAYGPLTGEIEDGETPFEAALRALEGTGLQFAESGLTLIADDLPVVISRT